MAAQYMICTLCSSMYVARSTYHPTCRRLFFSLDSEKRGRGSLCNVRSVIFSLVNIHVYNLLFISGSPSLPPFWPPPSFSPPTSSPACFFCMCV